MYPKALSVHLVVHLPSGKVGCTCTTDYSKVTMLIEDTYLEILSDWLANMKICSQTNPTKSEKTSRNNIWQKGEPRWILCVYKVTRAHTEMEMHVHTEWKPQNDPPHTHTPYQCTSLSLSHLCHKALLFVKNEDMISHKSTWNDGCRPTLPSKSR